MFRTPDEHELFLRLYGRSAEQRGWRTLAWTLMWNHHHFLIELTKGELSEGMRVLHSGFSRRMHEKYGQTGRGHFVRHCFYAGQLKTEDSVLEVARYIDLNAVRSGLSRKPEDWEWSSYRATVGLTHPRPFHHAAQFLELVARTPRAAQDEYRRFVRSGLVGTGRDSSSEQGYEAGDGSVVVESAT